MLAASHPRKIGLDRAREGAGEALARLRVEQPGGVGGVADVARFEQHRGHVGRFEDDERGALERFAAEPDRAPVFAQDQPGETGRALERLAPRKVEQDRGDFLR